MTKDKKTLVRLGSKLVYVTGEDRKELKAPTSLLAIVDMLRDALNDPNLSKDTKVTLVDVYEPVDEKGKPTGEQTEKEIIKDATIEEAINKLDQAILDSQQTRIVLSRSVNGLFSVSQLRGAIVISLFGENDAFADVWLNRAHTPTKGELETIYDTLKKTAPFFVKQVEAQYGITLSDSKIIVPGT